MPPQNKRLGKCYAATKFVDQNIGFNQSTFFNFFKHCFISLSSTAKGIKQLGLIALPVVKTFPGYNTTLITSLTYEREGFDVVMLGDSITAGVNWNKILENKQIANLGISGDTTEGVINRLEDIRLLSPKACFIMIGINDFQGNRSVEDTYNDYQKIIETLVVYNIKPIVQSVLTLHEDYYISHVKSKSRKDWENINRKVNELNEKLKKYTVDNGIEFVDLNAELCIENILDRQYTDDGIHLNSLGHKKWAEKIKGKLEI